MRKGLLITFVILALSACDKVGAGGVISQAFGNWAEVKLPEGCRAKQISAEQGSGVAVLCEDGRIFH